MAPRAPERREREDEYAAYLVVDHFGDLTLQHNDGNAAGAQVDYLIVENGDAVGALEVGRNTGQSRQRNVPRNTSFPAPVLDNSWDLTCSLDAAPTWNELKKDVIPVLQRMEIGGRTAGGPWRGSSRRSDRELAALHVLNAEVGPTIPPGGTPTVRLNVYWGDGSPPTPETPLTQLEQWLADPGDDQVGMRSRLRATDLAMRHVFVWTDIYATGAAGRWLDEFPGRDPDLPAEITHVWLASGRTGWSWAPDRGWRHIAHLDDASRIAQSVDYSK
jgi:hypothetical protein